MDISNTNISSILHFTPAEVVTATHVNFVVLIITAAIAIFMILAVLLKARSHRPIFYLNITTLLLTLALSLVNLPTAWNSIKTKHITLMDSSIALFTANILLLCSVKILSEVILIIRLRALYSQKYLFAICIFLVLLRTTCQVLSIICTSAHPKYKWLVAAEAFMTAANNMVFSSIFIFTLISRMRSVRRSLGSLRNHRLFFFLIFAIENMVLPCLTSISFAIFILFVGDSITRMMYAFTVCIGNICVTVVSIVMTTLLGTMSGSHGRHLPSLSDGIVKSPKNATPLHISRIAPVRDSRVDYEEMSELGFSNPERNS